MNQTDNPYSPPNFCDISAKESHHRIFLHCLVAAINIAMVIFLVGVPIFAVVSLAWILIKSAKLIHFNFYVLPEYNPSVAAIITTILLLMIMAIIYGNSVASFDGREDSSDSTGTAGNI